MRAPPSPTPRHPPPFSAPRLWWVSDSFPGVRLLRRPGGLRGSPSSGNPACGGRLPQPARRSTWSPNRPRTGWGQETRGPDAHNLRHPRLPPRLLAHYPHDPTVSAAQMSPGRLPAQNRRARKAEAGERSAQPRGHPLRRSPGLTGSRTALSSPPHVNLGFGGRLGAQPTEMLGRGLGGEGLDFPPARGSDRRPPGPTPETRKPTGRDRFGARSGANRRLDSDL